jgi:hypothetical protein
MSFSSPTCATAASVRDDLVSRLADDPWSLTLSERHDLRARHAAAQGRWLPRIRCLVEPPMPADSFPAFLLAIPPFARLGRNIGDAATSTDLALATADELQHFVDRYRTYLSED